MRENLQKVRYPAAGALAALLLGGCGGGGGSGINTTPSPPPAGSYDLQTAWVALLKTGLSNAVALSGTAIVSGSPYAFSGTGTYTLGATSSGTFNGGAALLQTQSITATLNVTSATQPFSSTGTSAFQASSGAILGQVSGTGSSSEYDVAQAPIAIPSAVGTAPVILGTLSRYTDSTLSVPEGTVQVSVAETQIPVDPGGSEVVTFTYKVYDANQSLIETDTYAYNLSEASTLTFNSAGTQTASGTLTVTPH